MMEAYGEGFEIMKRSADYPSLDLTQIAGIWNHASVVRSWLLELLEDALRKDPGLESIRGYVEDSGEGRWTVEAAINTSVPAPVIALSLFQRFASREPDAFSNKVLAALRNEFGGHAVQAEPAGSTAGGE
jgi:6-phosphogluconate dehydrogenase